MVQRADNQIDPRELINYRSYVLKTMWGGAMHWFAASEAQSNNDYRRKAKASLAFLARSM
jgi:hypothetical protein